MNSQNKNTQDETSFLEIFETIKTLVKNNKRFLLTTSIIFFISFAFYIIKTPKSYTTYSKIKILEDEDNSAFSVESMMNFSSPTSNSQEVKDEIEIITSKNVLEKVVTKLNLNDSYTKESFFNSKRYHFFNSPFILEISSEQKKLFYLNFENENKFVISNEEELSKTFSFDIPFVFLEDTIVISKSNSFIEEEVIGNTFIFKKDDPFIHFVSMGNRIKLDLITESIIKISLSGNHYKLNERIITTLLETYDLDRFTDKTIVFGRASAFLDERLNIIKDEIKVLESTLSEIRKSGDIFDMEAKNIVFGDQKMKSASMNFEVETQEILATSFLEKLNKQNTNEFLPLPFDIGINSLELTSFTNEFNELVSKKQGLLASRTVKNPDIKIINTQLNDLLASLQSSLSRYLSSLKLKKEKLSDYKKNIEYDYHKLNDVELTVLRLSKELEVKSNILLFLLQKLEENELKTSSKSPIFKVLDYTYTDLTKSSPKTLLSLIVGLILAICLPIGFVYIKHLFNTKISDKNSVERILNYNIPIIGEIPIINKDSADSQNTLIEAFRLLRTNLFFMLKKEEKTILVTSSIKGEGKSFVSVNTAKTLASLNNNKVLLVGLDLRNPQLHTALNISRNSSLGLSNFLMDNTIKIDSITEKVGEIDVIQSGPIPPNPTELLLSSNLQEIIKIAESKYDYVILDTSPCILVSDTLNFSKLASQTIYVTRSNHTDNNLLNYVNKLYSDKVFNKLSIVINGISDANLNYGYSYGYDQTTK